MTRTTRFAKQDIGGEILPILTTGLYRDTMDALREYIQNSIDAETKAIDLIVDPSTITVSDDGKGMSREEARDSIRLGISNKNPTYNVGFRGIGIYSSSTCVTAWKFSERKRAYRIASYSGLGKLDHDIRSDFG